MSLIFCRFLQLIDKKYLPKKFKISFFSVVRAELRLAAIYVRFEAP